ncbi:conserved hypothetical protein [Neospora caninum Liverpool]|uniref:Uncharacterized protein n=1 Tax=Neospora caninum (strain Liverpool) TaxID=572307 RepID=F0VPC6_NEOCL|nr:conserved hypothetical protein [Neospora caninum Liverpool]CBZ55572.1 conserved hypothetical protein [Neospora caninum Liverpool]|eukprot:XP_003885600.1 conserved hypothetical protein [Neospora caninum Liverpool]
MTDDVLAGTKPYNDADLAPHLQFSVRVSDPASSRTDVSRGGSDNAEMEQGYSASDNAEMATSNLRRAVGNNLNPDGAARPELEELLNFISAPEQATGAPPRRSFGLHDESDAKKNMSIVDACTWKLFHVSPAAASHAVGPSALPSTPENDGVVRAAAGTANGRCARGRNEQDGSCETEPGQTLVTAREPSMAFTFQDNQTNCGGETAYAGIIPKTDCIPTSARHHEGERGIHRESQTRCEGDEKVSKGLSEGADARDPRQTDTTETEGCRLGDCVGYPVAVSNDKESQSDLRGSAACADARRAQLCHEPSLCIEEEAAAFVTALHETLLTPQKLLNVSGSVSPVSLPMSIDETYADHHVIRSRDMSPFNRSEHSPSHRILQDLPPLQEHCEGQTRIPASKGDPSFEEGGMARGEKDQDDGGASWSPCDKTLFPLGGIKSSLPGASDGGEDLEGDEELRPKIDWEVDPEPCEERREGENVSPAEAYLSLSQEGGLQRSNQEDSSLDKGHGQVMDDDSGIAGGSGTGPSSSLSGKKAKPNRPGTGFCRLNLAQGLAFTRTNSGGSSSPGYAHSVFGRCSTYSSLHSTDGIWLQGLGSPLGACPLGSGVFGIDPKSGAVTREMAGECLGDEGGAFRTTVAFSPRDSRCGNRPSMAAPGAAIAGLCLSTVKQFYSDRCKHTLLWGGCQPRSGYGEQDSSTVDQSGMRFEERRASGLLQVQRQLKDVRQRLKSLCLRGTDFSAVCDDTESVVCCYMAGKIVPAHDVGELSRDVCASNPGTTPGGTAFDGDPVDPVETSSAVDGGAARFFEHLLLLTVQGKADRLGRDGDFSGGSDADRATHLGSRATWIKRKFRVASEILVLRSDQNSQDAIQGAAAVAAGLAKNEATPFPTDAVQRCQLLKTVLSLMSGGARDGDGDDQAGHACYSARTGNVRRSPRAGRVDDNLRVLGGSDATLEPSGCGGRSPSRSPSAQSRGSDGPSVCLHPPLSGSSLFRGLSPKDRNSYAADFRAEGSRFCPPAATSRDADTFTPSREAAAMWLPSRLPMSASELARQSSAEDHSRMQQGPEGGAPGAGTGRDGDQKPDSFVRNIQEVVSEDRTVSGRTFAFVVPPEAPRFGEVPRPAGRLCNPLESPALSRSDGTQAETGPRQFVGPADVPSEAAAAVAAASRLLDQYACEELRTDKREAGVSEVAAGARVDIPLHHGLESERLLLECGLRPRDGLGDSQQTRQFASSSEDTLPLPAAAQVGGREAHGGLDPMPPASAELMNALVQQVQHQLQQQIEQQLQIHRGAAAECLRPPALGSAVASQGASVQTLPPLSALNKQISGRGNSQLDASEAFPVSAIEAAAVALLESRRCSLSAARALRAPSASAAAPPALGRGAPTVPVISGSSSSTPLDILGMDGADDLHDFKEHCSVFISWIPRVARAEDHRQKEQMEKRLKLLFEVGLKVRGIVRVALFPPRGSHCCVLFETPQAAQAFIRQYGGSTYTSSTERFKAEICAAHAVTFDRGIERVFVRIEEFKPQLLQQTCSNQPAHGAGSSGSGCSPASSRPLSTAATAEGSGRQNSGHQRHQQGSLGPALAPFNSLRTPVENAREESFMQHRSLQQLMFLKQLRQEHNGESHLEEAHGSTPSTLSGFPAAGLPASPDLCSLQQERQRVLFRSQSAVQGALEIANFLSSRSGSKNLLQQRRHPRFGRAATMDMPSQSWLGGHRQAADIRGQNSVPAVHNRACAEAGTEGPFGAVYTAKPGEDEMDRQQLTKAGARLLSELKPEEQAELGQLWQALMLQQQSLFAAGGNGAPSLPRQSPSQQLLTAGLQQLRREQHFPKRRHRDSQNRGAERAAELHQGGKHSIPGRADVEGTVEHAVGVKRQFSVKQRVNVVSSIIFEWYLPFCR